MGLAAEFVCQRLDADKDAKVTVEEFGGSPGIHDETEAREALGRAGPDNSGALYWAGFETAHGLRHAMCKKVPPALPQPSRASGAT